jgi:hypothetical protein
MIKLFVSYADKKDKNIRYIPYFISKNNVDSMAVNANDNTWTASFSPIYFSRALEVTDKPLTSLASKHLLEEFKEVFDKRRFTINEQSKPSLIKFVLSL